MLQGDLFHQLPQAALDAFVLHPVDLFHGGGVHKLPHLAAKAQAAAGDNTLPALFVDDAEDIVVDDPLDPHPSASPKNGPPAQRKKTNPLLCLIQATAELV